MKVTEQIKKYQAMKSSELEKELEKETHEYSVLLLEVAGRKNKNSAKLKLCRKNIARILTIKNENRGN